jgi:Flp pilus assembly protein TadD
MLQPAASIAHLLAALAAGMVAGGALSASSQISGAGTQATLQSLLLVVLVFSLPRSKRARRTGLLALPLLMGPALLLSQIGFIHNLLVTQLGPVGAILVRQGWVDGIMFGLALLPLSRATRTALGARHRLSGIWGLLGLAASWALPGPIALGTAGLLLALADRTPSPHRGWREPSPWPWSARLLIVALSSSVTVLGWMALRSVVDPTPTGAAVVIGAALVGTCLGHALGPKRASSGLAWALVLCTIALGLVGGGSLLTDRVGSAAAAWEWGVNGRVWLLTPLVLLGLLGGAAMGRAVRADAATGLGIAVGLMLGAIGSAAGASVGMAFGTIGGLLALSLAPIPARGAGAAVAVAAIAMTSSGWIPTPGRMGPGIYDSMRSRDQWSAALTETPTTQWQAWVPSGTASIRIPETSGSSDARPTVHLELDGLAMRVPSRAAAAEELAGHLAALLSPDPSGIVVLNDPSGELVRGISAHPAAAAEVGIAYPGLLQLLAKKDSIRREAWLDPHIHTQRASAQRRLESTARASAIVELNRTPWTSGAGPGLTDTHIARASAALSPQGIYVLCTDLSWWEDGAPAALASTLAQHFEYLQVWLPPEGADSLIWIGSSQPISVGRLHSRFAGGSSAMERLGYGSAAALAGTAIASRAGALRWGHEAGALPSSRSLGESLFAKPVFHAAGLATLDEPIQAIWDTQEPGLELAEAEQVLQAKRMFLTLIDDAARGQIGAAFDTARALIETHGEVGARTLEPLIDPHIQDAEEALALGAAQGPTSDAWADAQRFATTARMIAPKSPRPHLILAEVALGRGDVQRAEGHYRAALTRSPKHIGALDGLARCGRLRGDDRQIEQSLRATTRHGARDWRTWHNLGIYLLEKGRLDEALSSLKDAAALAPATEAAPLIGMAKAYLAKGEAPGALVRAERAIRLDEDNAVGWYLRGRAHYELERFDEAESDFRTAVLADGKLVEARGAIGQVRAIRGDYRAAAEQFRAVLRLDPNNIPARENLRRLAPHLPDSEAAQP